MIDTYTYYETPEAAAKEIQYFKHRYKKDYVILIEPNSKYVITGIQYFISNYPTIRNRFVMSTNRAFNTKMYEDR